MQTATSERKSARETVFDGQQTGEIRRDVDLNAFRYFVQMGWEGLSVDSFGIPNAYLLRGEITPCRTYPCKANLVEIREGDLILGSEVRDDEGRGDGRGRIVWGSYHRYAHHEAERLIMLENRSERKTGLFEVTALSGPLGDEVYRKVDLNKLFFPGWPELPEKNSDVIAFLRSRIAHLKAHPESEVPGHYLPVIFGVGGQLVEAAERADFVQRDRLTFTHSCLRLTPKDEAYKRAYDDMDYEMLKRTGIPEVHAAEVQTAQALEKLSDDSGLKEMIELQRQQLEFQREESARRDKIIEMLLAERKETNGTSKRKPVSDSPAA